MPEKILGPLEGASETLLISLYLRARESQHPGAMLRDDLAVAMINQFQYDFSQIRFSIMTKSSSSCALYLPAVMALRRKLIHSKCSRDHTLVTSVLNDDWLEEVCQFRPSQFMFLAYLVILPTLVIGEIGIETVARSLLYKTSVES